MTLRRQFLQWAGAFALAQGMPTGVAAQPRYTVSADQLRQALARRFPLRYAVAGLFELEILAPLLRLMPEQNRVGAELPLQAAGPALRRTHGGDVDLDFALRYEPGDRSIRAHAVRVNAVRLPSLPRDAAALIDAYARASAQRAMLEIVLHTLRPQDLALADTMGFEPGEITVSADGLVIGFVPQRR